MIAKIVKGRGFRGALAYNLNQEKGRIIDSNMAGTTVDQLAKEFGQIRKLRPGLSKAVAHVSLSIAPGEQLSDQQWRDIGQRYLASMGFHDSQYLIVRHTDTEHEHIHILTNRISYSGQVVSDSQDYQRQENLMRTLEREYNLQRVLPSLECERKAPTKEEIEYSLRTQESPIRQRLQDLCDGAIQSSQSIGEYVQILHDAGVQVKAMTQKQGQKLNGLIYSIDETMMKASDLGRKYTPKGLEQKGISYEQDRDYAAICEATESRTHSRLGQRATEHSEHEATERGRASGDDRTLGTSDGQAHGRHERHALEDQPEERIFTAHDRRSATEYPDPQASEPTLGLNSLPDRIVDGHRFGSAHDRVVALAGPTHGANTDRPRTNPPDHSIRDRTLEAIKKQTQALGCERYEIGIRNQENGQMMNRNWSEEELHDNTAWLKRMNAQGHDVYIRPAGELHALILIDDLNTQKLDQLKRAGLRPAVSVETSPGNYQAWVKMSDQAINPELRKYVAQYLAKEFGGDPNSADSRHYGRLAGLTNQKPKYQQSGRQPYVVIHETSKTIDFGANKRLQHVQSAVDVHKVRREQENRLAALKTADFGYPGSGVRSPKKEYQSQAQNILNRYGKETDLSRMDWMITVSMAKTGYKAPDIERVLIECSPNIETRKAGHMEDYARRTVEKAFSTAEVMSVREHHLAHDRGRDRGHGGIER